MSEIIISYLFNLYTNTVTAAYDDDDDDDDVYCMFISSAPTIALDRKSLSFLCF